MKNRLVVLQLLVAGISLAATQAIAQAYPTKAIRPSCHFRRAAARTPWRAP